MTPSGLGIRSAAVTAAVVLATAGGLATAPAHAAAPDPTATASAQPSPTPSSTTSPAGTTDGPGLTLDPTSARPGDSVSVSFDGWDFKGCALDYDQAAQPTSTCTVVNGLLSGTVTVPRDATPNTSVPIAACPTECTGDNTIATALLTILPPLATSQPTAGPAGGAVPVKPPPTHRHRAAPSTSRHTATATPSHTSTLVAGGGVVVFLGSALGLLLLRRRPPTIGPPPDIQLVPRPDPGVVTVDPARASQIHAQITIRLRPDEGHCRVEAMQR
jgi:hypothetical protein